MVLERKKKDGINENSRKQSLVKFSKFIFTFIFKKTLLSIPLFVYLPVKIHTNGTFIKRWEARRFSANN